MYKLSGKTISVPLEYYQAIAALARNYLEWMMGNPIDVGVDEAELARFVRWAQWHDEAEERGLTRL